MQSKLIEKISNIVLLLLLFMAAVSYNGKLFGKKLENIIGTEEESIKILPPDAGQLKLLGLSDAVLDDESFGTWSVNRDNAGEYIINTSAFSEGIYGFAGPVPMYIYLDSDRKVKGILLQENSETPDFIESVKDNGIISQWIGKSSSDISSFKPDALSGATITSNAINNSIKQSLSASGGTSINRGVMDVFDIKSIVALLVIVFGLLLSFKSRANKKLRTIQLILNTAVLGLWCGKFISLKVMLSWTSNGVNVIAGMVLVIMLLLSVVLPIFFNKKSFYCNWICPFGSAQELAGKLNKNKVRIGNKTMNVLKHSREVITLGVFLLLWLGIATDIIDYEPFSAFIFQHASFAVILIALLSLLASVFTPRPWCRFACPTGQVLKWINKMN